MTYQAFNSLKKYATCKLYIMVRVHILFPKGVTLKI